MISQEIINDIKVKYNALKVELDERNRRMWAAAEAKTLGYGGVVSMANLISQFLAIDIS